MTLADWVFSLIKIKGDTQRNRNITKLRYYCGSFEYGKLVRHSTNPIVSVELEMLQLSDLRTLRKAKNMGNYTILWMVNNAPISESLRKEANLWLSDDEQTTKERYNLMLDGRILNKKMTIKKLQAEIRHLKSKKS